MANGWHVEDIKAAAPVNVEDLWLKLSAFGEAEWPTIAERPRSFGTAPQMNVQCGFLGSVIRE